MQARKEGKRPPRETLAQTLMFFRPYVRRVESSNGFQATPYVYGKESSSSSSSSNGGCFSGRGGGGDEAASSDGAEGRGAASRDEAGGHHHCVGGSLTAGGAPLAVLQLARASPRSSSWCCTALAPLPTFQMYIVWALSIATVAIRFPHGEKATAVMPRSDFGSSRTSFWGIGAAGSAGVGWGCPPLPADAGQGSHMQTLGTLRPTGPTWGRTEEGGSRLRA